MEALFPKQTHRRICLAFIERAIEADSVFWFNRLLEIELMEASFNLALRERWGSSWRSRRYDGRARRRATRLMDQVGAAWADLIVNNNYACVELDEVAEYAPQLMAQFGLGSNDAVHAASALYADVPSVATLDTAFANVPGIHVYTDDGRVSVCRRRRAEGAKRGVRFDEAPVIE